MTTVMVISAKTYEKNIHFTDVARIYFKCSNVNLFDKGTIIHAMPYSSEVIVTKNKIARSEPASATGRAGRFSIFGGSKVLNSDE